MRFEADAAEDPFPEMNKGLSAASSTGTYSRMVVACRRVTNSLCETEWPSLIDQHSISSRSTKCRDATSTA